MWMSFIGKKYIRCGRLVALLATCAIIILSVTTIQNFSVRLRHTVDGISQDDVDYFAKNILVRHRMIRNGVQIPFSSPNDDSYRLLFEAEISLTNLGNRVFPNIGWSIFFNQVLGVEPPHLLMQSTVEKPAQGIRLRHWNGELYSFEPTTFANIEPQKTKRFRFNSTCCSVVFTDVFPNWYIVFRGLEPRTMESTAGEPNQFVSPYNSSTTWKRIPDESHAEYDHYNPPKAKDRYVMDGIKDLGIAPIPVIPTPLFVELYKPSSTLNVLNQNLVIVSTPVFQSAVAVLLEKWKLEESQHLPVRDYVQFIQEEVKVKSHDTSLLPNETYRLSVSPVNNTITIRASHAAGAFYAVQSLLSLVDKQGNIPETIITDGPRYRYRGLMIDVARNFHGKESIKRYIDAMAMYKLNKLHLHLTDDEGWRIEIPDLPELTEVGGKRCHDPSETMCLLPFLGSGPHPVAPGSGFYTVDDYKDILRYAVAHHVEVIPEIDMPGHSHAAIKAMHARFLKLSPVDQIEATRYLLTDLQDESIYASVQSFKDGAVNPCVKSTFTFIKKIVSTLLDIHKDISPLKIFHFGGDEVPKTAWLNSSMCKELNRTGIVKSFKQIFAESVGDIASVYELNLAAWEDGLMNGEYPMPRTNFHQKEIYIYAWNNLWALGQAKRAYTFANAGYKVVLTPATTTYLDHPYEPEPTDRGLVWATRHISTKRVFQMMPENIYISEGTDISGNPIPECSSKIGSTECPSLRHKDNIEGIQGTLFGELTRTEWIIDFMVFPRLLALAERAWHAADWEYEPTTEKRNMEMKEDWVKFANTLGHKELARLDSNGYLYRIPPPGAIVVDKVVKASVELPGLEVQISIDGENVWSQLPPEGIAVQNVKDVLLRTKAADSDRYSRVVRLV